jgi:predicted ATP-dependent serine protease
MQFDTIGLKGKYKDLIGDPSVGFSCMVYGKPKSGKSTMSIDFAHHLALHHGKVLYAAIEEGYGYTMKEKLQRLKAVHKNLFVSEDIPRNLSPFDFVFIDSVSKDKVDNNKLNELISSNPKTAFIFIFHSTKTGDFRGGQENAHDVDCLIEVADGIATGRGRFGVGGEMGVFG